MNVILETHLWHYASGSRGLDRVVVGFTTTCAIHVYHHIRYKFEPSSWHGVLDATLCDKACQWLATGRLFSPGTPVSSASNADRHDMTEILLNTSVYSQPMLQKPVCRMVGGIYIPNLIPRGPIYLVAMTQRGHPGLLYYCLQLFR